MFEAVKKKTIRRKVQNMVLFIVVAALLATTAAGYFGMRSIQRESEASLIEQAKQNLQSITEGRAEMTNAVLSDYAGFIENSAGLITELYKDSSFYNPRTVLPPLKENGGILAMQRSLRDKNVKLEDVKRELELLGTAESLWKPAITNKSDIITTIYLGTESGLLLGYDKNSDLTPESGQEIYYNYTEAEWYKLAKEKKSVCFTDTYQDAYGRGTMITCAAPFYDAQGKFAGVTAMDILISDLHKAALDVNLGEDSFAFLLDKSWNIIASPDQKDEAVASVNNDFNAVSSFDMLSGKDGVFYADSSVYYAFSPIVRTGWFLCVRMPERVILSPVRSLNRSIIFTMLAFFTAFVIVSVLAVTAARKFSGRLTDPIVALEHDVSEISGGNLDYRAEVRTNDEIGDLAKSFNDMAASLKDYVKNLAAVTAEKERIGAELNIATQIQADMLPRIFPPFPERKEFDIYATMNPAKEVGGDFYDFFLVDNDHLALVMADVSGKGVPAALFMVIAKTLIKNRTQMGGTPSEVLADVNNQLCEGNEAELFVTVWLGILEISTGKVIASNAGHEYPAIYRKGESYALFKTKQSPAVATMEGLKFRESEFELKAGDALYIYTDGVAEATNSNDELYGTDRMLATLNETEGMSVEEILSFMKKSVDDFTGDAPQFDDITMLSLKYYGSEEKR